MLVQYFSSFRWTFQNLLFLVIMNQNLVFRKYSLLNGFDRSWNSEGLVDVSDDAVAVIAWYRRNRLGET